jgi:hypothetical protein
MHKADRSRGRGRSIGMVFKLLPALLFAGLVMTVSSPAQAYTWMIKHGYGSCLACHADPSGGETLTSYGRLISESFLSTRWGGEGGEEQSKFSEFMFGAIPLPETVLLGGSLRGAYTLKDGDFRVFPMQIDAYGQVKFDPLIVGGSIGLAKVPAGSPHARAAQVTTDQGDGYNLISRNFYVGAELMEQALIIRAGRLNLPFGVRIPEHTNWIREQTRTDRESDQQWGLALAYAGEKFRGELMGIAGNYQINPDEFRERGYSLYLEYFTSPTAAIGVSSLITMAKRDRLSLEPDVLRQAHGPYLRATLAKPLVLLAEANLLSYSDTELGYVGFAQLDYEPVQGLHLIGTGEIYDNGYPEDGGASGAVRSPGIGKPRYGGWASINWFFLTHFDARLDAIFRKDDPFTLLGQLHIYL